ncbi:MAG: cytochrome c oxidase subunit II [Pseudomonadota bacterium]
MVFNSMNYFFRVLGACWVLCLTLTQSAYSQSVEQAWEWYKPATQIAEQISSFHDMVFVIIVAITLFVLGLLVWVVIRYNEKANPEPSNVTHNTTIEVVWTLVPILILLVIAVPSFRLLSAQYTLPKPDVVVKTIGYQWYWGYEYPGKDISFESRMLDDEDIKKQKEKGDPAARLLAVDNPVVVPVNKVTYMYVTSEDVIHNWTVPAFGAKMDAIPGSPRLVWFKPTKTGIFYGQCSELCGINHAFMPIEIRVVSEDDYKKWQSLIKDDEEKAKDFLIQAYLDDVKSKTDKVAENSSKRTLKHLE